MTKCRICFQTKSNICSLFETEKGITYGAMLKFISHVQIEQEWNNMICLLCKNKLKDLYEFKMLIERSDFQLNYHIKRFKFNNINDVMYKLCNKIGEKNNKINGSKENPANIFHFDGQDIIAYKNLVIKKIKKDIHFEDDLDNDDNIELDFHDLNECIDKDITKHRRKQKKNEKLKNEMTEKGVKFRIKPIYLDDLRVISNNYGTKCKKQSVSKKLQTKRVICPYCGVLIANMNKHILIHTAERKYKCSKCNQRFYKENILQNHLKRHSNTNLYKCEHCVGTFTQKGSLVRHMLTHQNARQFVCKLCNKSFKFQSSLNRHGLTHGDVRTHVECDVCHMRFVEKSTLRNHMRVHTKERPYNCELCLQPYSYKRDFNRHCFKKHGVFLKRRSVYVMNSEVLEREKEITQDLVNRVQHFLKGDQSLSSSLNPFEGPQGAQAFKLAVKQLQTNNQIPSDFFQRK